jgi:hypothetical protein
MRKIPPWLDKLLRRLERWAYPIAFMTAVFGMAYWYWTTTPSYALTAVVVSVKNRDIDMFEKYVDVNSVISHAFDDIVQGPISGEIMGRQNSFIGMGFVRFFKREIVELAHGKVDEYVGEGHLKLAENVPTTVNPITALAVMNSGHLVHAAVGDKQEALAPAPVHESKNDKLKRILREYGISKFGYRGVKYLRIEGPKAFLGIEFFAPRLNKKWVAEFQLEDAGGYWQVTQLANLSQIVDMYMATREVATR